MLSILIPTYNYNVYPLVENLRKRALKSDIIFEIICIDDGSNSNLNSKNEHINSLTNCKFIERKTNIGRTATRQELAKQAQYDWLLFLDADVMPKNDAFLTQYMSLTLEPIEAVFGGFAYRELDYKKENSLRYYFGKKREETDASIRNKNPYKITISANFLIKKNIFTNNLDLSNENRYGLDYMFGATLKKHKVQVLHINNEVYHRAIDTNSAFIDKTKCALKTLKTLFLEKKIEDHEISILKAYLKLKAFRINNAYGSFFKLFNKTIENYLLSSNSPSLLIFDLYRLGYFCRIKSNT